MINKKAEGQLRGYVLGALFFVFSFTVILVLLSSFLSGYSVSTSGNDSNESEVFQDFVTELSGDNTHLASNITDAVEKAQVSQEDIPRDPISAVWDAIKSTQEASKIATDGIYLISNTVTIIPNSVWQLLISISSVIVAFAIISFWWKRDA